VKFGGNANNSANAGAFYVNSNNTSSNANVNIGRRLCLWRSKDLEPETLPLGKTQSKAPLVLVGPAHAEVERSGAK